MIIILIIEIGKELLMPIIPSSGSFFLYIILFIIYMLAYVLCIYLLIGNPLKNAIKNKEPDNLDKI